MSGLDLFQLLEGLESINAGENNKMSCLVHALFTAVLLTVHAAPYVEELVKVCKKGHAHMQGAPLLPAVTPREPRQVPPALHRIGPCPITKLSLPGTHTGMSNWTISSLAHAALLISIGLRKSADAAFDDKQLKIYRVRANETGRSKGKDHYTRACRCAMYSCGPWTASLAPCAQLLTEYSLNVPCNACAAS